MPVCEANDQIRRTFFPNRTSLLKCMFGLCPMMLITIYGTDIAAECRTKLLQPGAKELKITKRTDLES